VRVGEGLGVTAGPGEEVFRYVVHYGDNKTGAFAVKNGVDVADWANPKAGANAKVVWRSEKGKGVYLSAWENPRPNQKIKWIDVVGTDKGCAGVLAITVVTGPPAK
jgi:hypothetical protein